jgi:hypothetical protein
MSKKIKSYQKLRDAIIPIIKEYAVKWGVTTALTAIGVSVGGIYSWVATILAKILFDFIMEPLLQWSIRKGFLLYDTVDGQIKVKKLHKAKDENNQDDYDSTLDDIIK